MKLFLVALLFNLSSAFRTLQLQARHDTRLRAQLMNEMDSMCIMNAAKYCIQEECSLDEKEALINRLEEQSHILDERLEDLRPIMTSLIPRPKAVALAGGQPRGSLLSDIDLICIENAARACNFAYECDLDDREALVNRLTEQSSLLHHRMHEMVSLTHRLERSNVVMGHHGDVDSLMKSIKNALIMDFASFPLVTEEYVIVAGQ